MATEKAGQILLVTALDNPDLLARVGNGELELVPITDEDGFWEQRNRSELSAVSVSPDCFMDALSTVASDIFGFGFKHQESGAYLYLLGHYIIEVTYGMISLGWNLGTATGYSFEARSFTSPEEALREFKDLKGGAERLISSTSILPIEVDVNV